MAANETVAVPRTATESPVQPLEERQGEGHGRRLTAAFEALEGFPALAEARNRLLALVGNHRIPLADVVETVEADIALVVAVLRFANEAPGRGGARIENIPDAVRVLSPEAVHQLAERMRTFDYFERSAVWEGAPDRFRLHALATRAAAELLAVEIGYPDRDRLIVSALLHDIGKLVLMHAYSGYPAAVHRDARTPEERVQRERRELGVDHAVVGGVLARRWGRSRSQTRSSAITPMSSMAMPLSSASPTCSRTMCTTIPSRRPTCCVSPEPRVSGRPSCARFSTSCPSLPAPAAGA